MLIFVFSVCKQQRAKVGGWRMEDDVDCRMCVMKKEIWKEEETTPGSLWELVALH